MRHKPSVTKRLVYLDLMRILATFLVIVLHTNSAVWNKKDFNSNYWKAFNLFDAVSRVGVPLFVMISGFFHLDNTHEHTLYTLFFRKLYKLLTSYIFWASFYAYMIWKPVSIWQFLSKIVPGPVHLWYMPMIFGLYVITPILRRITADTFSTQYYLILSVLFTFVLDFLFKINEVGLLDIHQNRHHRKSQL